MQTLIFDIESTGLNPEADRIVQLAIMIIDKEGDVVLNKSKLYNPEIPISQEAFDTHGIGSEKVKDCPAFRDDAKKLKKLFEDKVIVTYNGLKFDIPLLIAEFERAGVELNLSGKYIDCLLVERKLNSNKLSDTYKRYTGKELEDAHNAEADLLATKVILEGQVSKVFELKGSNENQNLEEIAEEIYELSGTKNLVDLSGKLARDAEGFLIFNFGKNLGKRIIKEEQYACWMLNQSFSKQVKDLIREEQIRLTVKTK